MNKIQKNGMNGQNTTRRRRRRNVPKGKKRNGQMKILVNDQSLVGAAEIYGKSHHKGGKIPGYKVLVVDDLMKAYRKIGVKKAIIYPVPTEMAA
jgi:hypothetical protein